MIDYKGYKVSSDGEVYNKYDSKMFKTTSKSGTKVFNLRIDGKFYNIPCARFIYQAHNQDQDLSDYLVKTSIEDNYAIENLYLVKKKEINENRFTRMKTKKEIFNRMIQKKKQNEDYEDLLWVLGDLNA